MKSVVDAVLGGTWPDRRSSQQCGHHDHGRAREASEEQWDTVLDVNLRSAFLACKHALPAMIRQGKGVIINISSMAAIRYTGYPYSAYYAAKAGVNQFTVGLAMQYARQGIRANVIMPGLMNTPLIYRRSAVSTPTSK